MHALEKALAKQLFEFPEVMSEAGKTYSPAVLCHYLLELAKAFNRVYNELPILKETDEAKKFRRLQMASFTAMVIQNGLRVLGIKTVERM
jgi:arginyl-tRNA synthetase